LSFTLDTFQLRITFVLTAGLDEITTNLSLCVPSVAKWKLASLPKFIKPDQVQIVLQSFDLQTSKGKRNYAIILLL